jgi:LuxR family maltose regulon positive regulatory protein
MVVTVASEREPGVNRPLQPVLVPVRLAVVAAHSFRFRPPAAAVRPAIDRPRLLAALAGRFDRRVTMVVAGPGFGKTALLAAAVGENELHPAGLDVWLRCRPDDSDGGELATGLLAALGRQGPPSTDAVVDAVWSRAPDDVAVVLDDAHEIAAGSAGEQLVAELVGTLPRNGHLVVSGRRALSVPTAKLRLSDDVVELREPDLAFDDDELERFASARGVAPDLFAAVRWPAVAELVVVAGHDAATEYLWEEVLAQLDPDVVDAVAALQPLGEIDDELVAAVTGIRQSAAELLGDLPLTERTPDGALRLHALWEPALRRRLDPDDEREALMRGAATLLARGDLRRAFEVSARAGDLEGQRVTVRSAMLKPLARTKLDDLRFLADRLPPGLELEVEAALLQAFLSLGGLETTAIQRFEDAAALARSRGDVEAECVALWRLYQSELWAGDAKRVPDIIGRSAELAEQGAALGEVLVEIESAVELGRLGRRDDALRILNAAEREGRDAVLAQTVDLRDGVLLDLGCPEEVISPGATPADLVGLAAEDSRILPAHALWLRGDVPPEPGFAVGRALATDVAETRVTHQHVALLGILSLVAVHAGEIDAAVELIERGKALVHQIVAGNAANFLRVAEATLAVARHDERRAATLLADALYDVPIDVLPARSYLNVLPLLHLLVPETRPVIDTANLGPALTEVQAMARALTAVRDDGDVGPATALPWWGVNLLRAHVAPPHLAELAVGALAGGATTAETVLDQLPDPRAQLQWVISQHGGPVAELARDRLAALPTRPTSTLHVELLGGPALYRDSIPVTDGTWKRERVRQILCFLLAHPVTTRRELTAALWPDLDEHGAAGNLRTNLTHLQRVLQPDRPRDATPWFVRAEGETLSLCTDGLTTDVERFDALVEEGRRFEDRGVPGTALARYLEAVELYRGDYLVGVDDSWAAYERIRLRSAFVTAATRAGELVLARGEPEQALRLADRVAAVDELAERAHRLRVQCLLAVGDRSAARASGERLLGLLARADLVPERETTRLLSPLGL